MENNQIQIFSSSEFGEIRTVVIDNEPWFVGRDVANALGYSKPQKAIRDRVRERDTLKQGISDINNHMQEMLIINESGLYRLIFGSQLPSAEKFQDWVYDEVLPSIRKTGFYQAPMSIDDQIELLSKGHGKLKAEIREVKTELDKFKEELPLLPAEMQEVTDAVHRKGVDVMGGKKSNAYHDRSICNSVYRDIYNEIHRNFDCHSYKSIPRKYLGRILDVVSKYCLPIVIEDRIKEANAQMALEM